MEYIVDGRQMKQIDRDTIEEIGLPASVLMERAAASVASHAREMLQNSENDRRKSKILALYGNGGNGGDAVAAARILHLQGYCVELCAVKDGKHDASELLRMELSIAKKCGVLECEISPAQIDYSNYALVLDGVFGIGLSRNVQEDYAQLFHKLEAAHARVLAIDIPSGISANTGAIMGACIRAERTVTFGSRKVGQLLYPGAEMCGELYVEDIGFPLFLTERTVTETANTYYIYHSEDLSRLPERMAHSHKGTYGHVLVWAGSSETTGAAYLAAQAAYRSGVGLVKLISQKECIDAVRTMLPELLTQILGLQSVWKPEDTKQLHMNLEWAQTVLAGPGIGTDADAAAQLDEVLFCAGQKKKQLVLDADAINLLAQKLQKNTVEARLEELAMLLPENTILTPHPKELSRLLGIETERITANQLETAKLCGSLKSLVWVLKDARTLVVRGREIYINTTGCDGMATGGSGDVLAGIIAGLSVSLEPFEAAKLGVYLHGAAGERAAAKRSARAMLAGDMLAELAF